MTDVLVSPPDRGCSPVVVSDVAQELVREILHRGEDTARNYVALDLGEPDLYLVKPAGVSRSVMDPNGRVGCKEFKNGFGLMCTQIIGNDVDLAAGWLRGHDLGKEIDKLRTGVACAGFSKNLSALRIEGGIERKGSMAIVLEAMPFGSPWREWQNRVQAIKCLDGTLFVDAEYSGMHRRFEIQSDNVGGLLFKLRIVADHVAARTVGLQPKLPPHSTYRD